MTGEVVRVTEDAAVLSIGGAIGIRVEMPSTDLASLGGTTTVHTVLQIRDDDVRLYGFATERGRELFRALTTVSGIGPRLALAVLSFHGPTSLERAIASADSDALLLVPGVGKKTAQRITLELKDKLGVAEPAADVGPTAGVLAEVREALKGLGYTAEEVQKAVSDLPDDGDTPTLLRHALRELGAPEAAGVTR